ncbi:hypothetical protein Vretimale_7717 [Volvox reticuliferus]|uniref:Uncharacterized protein n=1 Tax=Volvox reticuliferus TaxID=1737510 RepID=A0A8J4CBA5_9CHLO|nr:hypothetical protein Vretifemale_7784 [Volvox reticuliferus]GIM02890.1 hypothetical protein Vretimale_7717 [Volvox reticuliferus]
MSFRQHFKAQTTPRDELHTSSHGVRGNSKNAVCHGGRQVLPATSTRRGLHLHLTPKATSSCSEDARTTTTSASESSWYHSEKTSRASEEINSRLLHSFVATLGAASLLVGSCLAPGPALSRPRLTPEEQLTIEIFKESTPSVVNVTNLAIKRDAFTMNMLEMPQGQGSGFIWDTVGHVVTNYHVIQDASDIKVTLANGEELSATLVGVDQDKDIAVLQIGPPQLSGAEGELMAGPTSSLTSQSQPMAAGGSGAGSGMAGIVAAEAVQVSPTVRLAPLSLCSSSADIVVGQKVFAIGNPFGLDHTLTVGVVSGTGREIQSISGRPIQDVIQTDAAINPGNSGGPLLDSGGCLIGINTAIYSPTGANNGVGFAIPVDIVKSSVGQIIQYGKVTRPMLGISFAPDMSSEALGIKAGILVLSAREGGPAWKAGLKGSTRDEYGRLVLGDIITAVNGVKIKSSSDLYRVLDKAQVGDTLRITVLRENSTFEVDVTLESSSPSGGSSGAMQPEQLTPRAQPGQDGPRVKPK